MLSPQLLIDLGKSLQLPHALPAVKQLQQQQCQWEEKKISERNLIEEKFKNQIEVARQRQLPTLNSIEERMKMELKKFDQKLLIELDALCRQQRKRLEDFGIAGFTPGDDQQIAERRIDDPWFQTKKQMLIIKNIICPML